MNYRVGSLKGLLDSIPCHIPITVLNQVGIGGRQEIIETRVREGVRCVTYPEIGLSRSRNRLLKHATGEFLLICDDDVVFEQGAFEEIEKALLLYPNDDVFSFVMRDSEGLPRKRYSSTSRRLNKWSIARVSSCEIGFWRQRVLEKGIQFDERFGLGATFQGGEEVIFLKDCLDYGLRLRFCPIAISRHPIESTGRKMTDVTEYARGALFNRLYGSQALVLAPFFYLRKRVTLGNRVKISRLLRAFAKGYGDFNRVHG